MALSDFVGPQACIEKRQRTIKSDSTFFTYPRAKSFYQNDVRLRGVGGVIITPFTPQGVTELMVKHMTNGGVITDPLSSI